jgi:hypothetical protein
MLLPVLVFDTPLLAAGRFILGCGLVPNEIADGGSQIAD